MHIQMGQFAGRPWWTTNKQAIIACETCITVLKIISGDQGEFLGQKSEKISNKIKSLI